MGGISEESCAPPPTKNGFHVPLVDEVMFSLAQSLQAAGASGAGLDRHRSGGVVCLALVLSQGVGNEPERGVRETASML